ncbi:MAG TPA: HRDC domain-containing protein [Syntrophobacteria bacterium]|nr:HRDC domain-containing protein [Syntrophobacteria bacterium]
MNPPQLITRQADLLALLRDWRHERHLAIDTETDSFYAYTPRVCLIQISCGRGDVIIDALTIEDLSPLAILLADPGIEKILHAANNDLIGLRRDFRFTVHTVFDTAIAARLLGRRQLGLAAILAEEFGVTSDKKLQRGDWAKRPLSADQLYYAQRDTHFLIELRHRLHRQLVAKRLWEAAQKRFALLERLRPKPERHPNPKSYLRLKGAEDLADDSLRALKALFAYRERLAQKANRAPFRVMTNEVLIRLARELPRDLGSLLCIRGLPGRFRGTAAQELLRLLKG